jgi:hypothetical protein
MLIRIGLIGVLGIAPLGQSERRWEQIRDLLGKSDLVVVAVAEEYRPVIDRLAYRKERERHPAPDPARAERYMVGVVYQMTVREVIYRHPKRAERMPWLGNRVRHCSFMCRGGWRTRASSAKRLFYPAASISSS